jgi:quercetin dioxygenase-like cupin family protein
MEMKFPATLGENGAIKTSEVTHIRANAEATKSLADSGSGMKLLAEQADGALGLIEVTVPPGEDFAPQIISDADSTVYLVGGELSYLMGDEEFTAKAGDLVQVPRGAMRRFTNAGTVTTRLILLFTKRAPEISPTSSAAVPPLIATLQMIAGFQVSQAIYVVAKLNIPTILEVKGPQTIDQLAAEAGADADALGRVIRFLASLGFFRRTGGHIEVTELGANLRNGGSSYYGAIYWMETHYAPFGELLHAVRTGETAASRYYGKPFFEWIADDPKRAELQNRTFGARADNGLRRSMLDSYELPAGAVVADVGGADGAILARLLVRAPDRRGIVFDIPPVVADAADVIAKNGLEDRVRIVGGDFFESVPAADIYILSYVLHDWSDHECRKILGNIAKAAEPGARLVIIESVMPGDDVPHPTKVIDITMLAMFSGRERTEDEYRALLDSADFTLDRIVSSSAPFSFIEATLREGKPL